MAYKKDILVTGGAGFIGSHLSEKLLKCGHRVYVIDNLSTGSLANIEYLQQSPRFSFIKGSVIDETLMQDLINQVDYIYHLAAAVGVKYIMDNPLESIKTNARGVEIVLELASQEKKRILIASSSGVYGKDGKVPYKESGDRLMGAASTHRWSYASTKAFGEFLALAYWYDQQLPVVIVRLFNTCGARQTGQYGMVIPRFVELALMGEPITIYGDGTQSRCFTDVLDATEAMILVMENANTVGEIFNIGNTEEISINQLACRIAELTDSSSEIRYVPYEKVYGSKFEDMRRRVPDISKIKDFTNWEPRIKTDEILRRVIESYRNNH